MVDTASDATKIADSAIVVDTYDTSDLVLVTTCSGTTCPKYNKRRKRSVKEGELHTYGGVLPPGCKYGMTR